MEQTESHGTERKKLGLNTETEFSNTERLKSGIKIFLMKKIIFLYFLSTEMRKRKFPHRIIF